MTDKLTQIEKRYLEVESSLSDAEVVSDMERYKALMKEYKELTPITEAFRAYKKNASDLEEAELLLGENDPELKELAEEQAEEAKASMEKLEEELKLLLLPKDPDDDKNVVVEIRAGADKIHVYNEHGDLIRTHDRSYTPKSWAVIPSDMPKEYGDYGYM